MPMKPKVHQINFPNIKKSSHILPEMKGCSLCEKTDLEPILFESANFYVILDFAPIKEGHLMIISNEHYGCAGEMPDDLLYELKLLKEKMEKLVEQTYQKKLCYEHGRAGHCFTMKDSEVLCNHFHLHIVPAIADISNLLKNEFQKKDVKSYDELNTMYARYGSYLYFENNKNEMSFYPASDEIVAPHLLRTLICKKLRTPKRSDWEHYRNKKEILNAHKKYLENYFKNHHE